MIPADLWLVAFIEKWRMFDHWFNAAMNFHDHCILGIEGPDEWLARWVDVWRGPQWYAREYRTAAVTIAGLAGVLIWPLPGRWTAVALDA